MEGAVLERRSEGVSRMRSVRGVERVERAVVIVLRMAARVGLVSVWVFWADALADVEVVD